MVIPEWNKWQAASGFSTQTHGTYSQWDWWVHRYKDGPGLTSEVAETKNGRRRVFKSYKSAQRAADKLNRQLAICR